ncbi:ADP-ribosylglycohydrolase family protein [Limnochorda pilosa]|uniref:ADP-ribosylglycohydrolase n=1 Tax=Limnochorda pilosa TaxID=1555112 RepID=A0A0K2SL99_LIMPI|nr:ADP-ribosylglycohydrolase family protein [Limnochorda pilosa]BAS27896.1 hypothetical protein LIP_2055 [Limnochorda pilosa]
MTSQQQVDDQALSSRILGCLTGVGVGDALGMPTEFLSAAQIRQLFGEVRTFQAAPAWHPLAQLAAGRMTDDTEQTLAIARLVTQKAVFTARDVAEALLGWAAEMDLDSLDRMGPSTNHALKLLRAGEDPYRTGLRGNTNGAAIRIAPVGCVYPGAPEDVLDAVVEVCAPTHLTDVAVAGSTAVASGVARALQASTLDEVFEAMLWGARRGEERAREVIEVATDGRVPWEVISGQINPSLALRLEWALDLAASLKGSPRERRDRLARAIGTGALMIETVPLVAGILRIAEGDPYEAVVLAANAGGDTDSLASIVGGVAGALHGVAAFPQELVRAFERANEVSLARVADGLVRRATMSRTAGSVRPGGVPDA